MFDFTDPIRWQVTLAAVAAITLGLLVLGWLIKMQRLPIQPELKFEASDFTFIRWWTVVAGVIGLVCPAIALIVYRHHSDIQLFWGIYLLVLIIQISTETGFSRLFSSSMVVPIGTVYTLFRLWQLWMGRSLLLANSSLENYSAVFSNSLWWLSSLFWLSNLIMLLVFAWPRISQPLDSKL
ncbi:MAG TPA: hypothetical protein V6C78_24930 [Crinalium sp.]|jgi:hypothetical protein